MQGEVKVEFVICREGFANVGGHQYVPFYLVIVAISYHHKILLKHIWCLALFADDVCRVITVYKLVDYLQLHLTQPTNHLNGVIYQSLGNTPCSLDFLHVWTNVKVKLLEDAQHIGFGCRVENLEEAYIVSSIIF